MRRRIRLFSAPLMAILCVFNWAQATPDSRATGSPAQIPNSDTVLQSTRANKFGNWFAGYRMGIPYIAGLRGEYVLKWSPNAKPAFLLAADVALTYGYSAAIALESQLGNSSIFIGGGYNYTWFAFGVSGGDVAVVLANSFHSGQFSLTWRSNYQRENIIGISLGALISPSFSETHYLFPMIHLILISD